MDFGTTHIFKSFSSSKDREKWWIGRLVKVKKNLNTMFMKTPSPDEIGLVIGIQHTGIGYHLNVFFVSFNACSWIMTNDVYSMPDRF